jgi:hypothetical protein
VASDCVACLLPFSSHGHRSASKQERLASLDYMASILSRADRLKINTKLVARVPEVFEVDDLDRCVCFVFFCVPKQNTCIHVWECLSSDVLVDQDDR